MPFKLLLILGGLSAFGPLAIDMYLPAFTAMALDFAVQIEQVQLSMSVYFAGLACGQLVYGPIADRFGRRPPLMFGIALFAIASLGCALAPTLEWLLAARFVQSLGACAGMVVNRAVVRDLCTPLESAQVFSRLMLVMGVAPILAPLLGGLLLLWGGWQSIFLFLCGFAGLFLWLVLRSLPETLAEAARRPPISKALGSYFRLLGDAPFMLHALTGGLTMAGMFAWIAASPFVIMHLYGVSAEHFGWFFGLNAAGFILFAQLNGWLLRRRSPQRLLPFTTGAYLLAAIWLLLAALSQPQSLWLLMLPLFFGVSLGALVMPNATACAMAGQGEQAGLASALMGTLQFIIAGLTSALVGWLHDGSALPLAQVMLGCALLVLLCAVLARRYSSPSLFR